MRSYITISTLLLAASCGSVSAIGSDGGQGGSPGAGGATCAQIEADYQGALASARKCSVGVAAQCQEKVQSALDCTGCPTFVKDSNYVAMFEDDAWGRAGCNQKQLCPAIACVSPTGATCQPTDAGGATCVDYFLAKPATSTN